jgi:nitronate monooxygenase
VTPLTVVDSPVVLAPMAGGPTTVDLVATVTDAGCFGFLAGAYLTPDRLRGEIRELRSRTDRPFGVNVFAPSPDEPAMQGQAEAYAGRLAPWAAAAGVPLGTPRWDDDWFADKVAVLIEERPALVSFAFAWPPSDVVDALHDAGIEVWSTLNNPAEVVWAAELGVDGVVAQGWEAGGHRGGPVDSGDRQPDVRDLVRQLRTATSLPLMAAGGVMDASGATELLALGASAVALGTAFLASDEAGTAPVHRAALTARKGSVVTRAFTGRTARALATSWTARFTQGAPAAYPHVHHLTAPLRAYGKATGQADLVHLWAGTGHARVRSAPAGAIARDLLQGIGEAGIRRK